MKKAGVVALILAAVLLFGGGVVIGASTTSGEPGSVNDPLVSKSYLDERLSKVSGSGSTSSFEKVSLASGQKLKLSEGAQLVMVNGSATVFGNGGLINLTTGELFKNSNTAVLNCLYISVDSSNGIKANGKVEAFVLGNFTIS